MGTEISAGRMVESARDMLVYSLEAAKHSVLIAIADISKKEFHWEPLTEIERSSDLYLAPDRKKVWRVFQKEGLWVYDYTPDSLAVPPFTTIAWIMNHIAQTGDMYLYCIQTGIPEGKDRTWDDLPVYPNEERMRRYIFQVLDDVKEYLKAISEEDVDAELNRLTPAPWGEMRPTYENLWGGIIGHTIEHAAQISVLRHRIQVGY